MIDTLYQNLYYSVIRYLDLNKIVALGRNFNSSRKKRIATYVH